MALTNSDIKEIEKITKKEIKSFLETTQAHNIVVKMIQDELGTKNIDNKIVDISTVFLFHSSSQAPRMDIATENREDQLKHYKIYN
jgi:hypothetical protein